MRLRSGWSNSSEINTLIIRLDESHLAITCIIRAINVIRLISPKRSSLTALAKIASWCKTRENLLARQTLHFHFPLTFQYFPCFVNYHHNSAAYLMYSKFNIALFTVSHVTLLQLERHVPRSSFLFWKFLHLDASQNFLTIMLTFVVSKKETNPWNKIFRNFLKYQLRHRVRLVAKIIPCFISFLITQSQ